MSIRRITRRAGDFNSWWKSERSEDSRLTHTHTHTLLPRFSRDVIDSSPFFPSTLLFVFPLAIERHQALPLPVQARCEARHEHHLRARNPLQYCKPDDQEPLRFVINLPQPFRFLSPQTTRTLKHRNEREKKNKTRKIEHRQGPTSASGRRKPIKTPPPKKNTRYKHLIHTISSPPNPPYRSSPPPPCCSIVTPYDVSLHSDVLDRNNPEHLKISI